MKVFLIFCTMLLPLAGSVMAQTELLNVLWDANTEPDIDRYKLQRAVNGANNFQDIATVNHPTVQVMDTDVTSGNLYTYRVAAIDQSGNMSSFSTVVDAGLPKLDLSLAEIPNTQPHILQIADFLTDPDHHPDALTITIDQESNAAVTIQNGALEISASPADYSGPASFRIRAEDADGLFDVQTISLTFTAPAITEITIHIPNLNFDEDSSVEVLLDDAVTVSNTTVADLSWSFSGGANLDFLYDPLQRRLTLSTAAENWFGQNSVTATATAPDQTSATAEFQVSVNPVNDAPVAEISQFDVYSDPDSNIFDLTAYATDIDNPAAELSWDFEGFQNYTFEWVNKTDDIVKIVPGNGASTETGTFRVSDPSGASDAAGVMLIMNTIDDGGLFEVNIPDVQFDEDGRLEMLLDDYVTGSTANAAELSWSFSGGPNLNFLYDPLKRILTISAAAEHWFGQNSVTATAVGPNQHSATAAFQVSVNPMNDPPVASITQLQVFSDPDSNIIDLKPYAADIDNPPAELNWAFEGFQNFTFEWVNQSANIVKIIPAEGAATETGTFRVSDPSGAENTANVTLIIDTPNDGGVFEVSIPDVQVNEDQQLSLLMDAFVTLSGALLEDVGWSFSPGPNLQFAFNAANRNLTIQAKAPNWFGSDEMTAIATLPGKPTQTVTFAVTVLGVNDSPQLNLQTLAIDPLNANRFDLKPFASDVEDSGDALTWSFEGFTQFNIQMVDPGQQIIEIFPIDGATTETGTVRVSDTEGGTAISSLTLEMIENILHTYDVSVLGGKKDDEVDVRITVDVPARVEFRYWLDDSRISAEILPGLKKNHKFTLKKLLPDTTYSYNASIRDRDGALIGVVDSTFHTAGIRLTGRADPRDIFVYPNPVKPQEGHREMIFSNLPEESKSISLFALNGDRVFQEAFQDPAAEEHRVNFEETGLRMPSGMYIYLVKDENAQVLKTGKIVVVR